jgi:hypothetical protein
VAEVELLLGPGGELVEGGADPLEAHEAQEAHGRGDGLLHGEIGAEGRLHPRPLHLEGQLAAIEARHVHLGDGGAGEGLLLDLVEQLREGGAELLPHHRREVGDRHRLQSIEQVVEGARVLGTHEVGLEGEELTELDVGAAQGLERVAQPPRPPERVPRVDRARSREARLLDELGEQRGAAPPQDPQRAREQQQGEAEAGAQGDPPQKLRASSTKAARFLRRRPKKLASPPLNTSPPTVSSSSSVTSQVSFGRR